MTEWCTERDRMMSKINECQFNFVYLYGIRTNNEELKNTEPLTYNEQQQ